MGKLAEIKTKQTSMSVEDFIERIPDVQKRNDCQTGKIISYPMGVGVIIYHEHF